MTDLFEAAETSPAAPPQRPVAKKSERRFAGMSVREIIFLVLAVVAFLWAAWVTKSLLTQDSDDQEFVQLQLQGIIGEYLQSQARSSADEQTAAQQTAVFMTTLDQTVAGLSQSGKVVLVHEAIIGGNIPDVTDSVKAAVYEKVPRPQPAQAAVNPQQNQAARVQGEMLAFIASDAGE